MKPRQKLIIASVASVIAMGGGLFAHSAFAAGTTGDTGLASFLATKFNLKQADVTSALSDYHVQQDATRAQAETDKLNAAVTAGTITSAQKDLIVAKRAAIKQQMDALHADTTKTAAERKAAMDQIMTDTKTWATQNGIDLKWLGPGAGGRHGGPGMMHDGGTPPADAPAN